MKNNNQRNSITLITYWNKKALIAKREAHKILATHESSVSRVILLEDLLKSLNDLPIDVQDYFKEAIVCLENYLLRSAIVLSWSGFFHVILEKNYNENENKIRRIRDKWHFNDINELKENYGEYQILETLRKANLITRSEFKVYQGQLSLRNKCAHPTLFKPSLNSSIGFVDDMIRQSMKYIK